MLARRGRASRPDTGALTVGRDRHKRQDPADVATSSPARRLTRRLTRCWCVAANGPACGHGRAWPAHRPPAARTGSSPRLRRWRQQWRRLQRPGHGATRPRAERSGLAHAFQFGAHLSPATAAKRALTCCSVIFQLSLEGDHGRRLIGTALFRYVSRRDTYAHDREHEGQARGERGRGPVRQGLPGRSGQADASHAVGARCRHDPRGSEVSTGEPPR